MQVSPFLQKSLARLGSNASCGAGRSSVPCRLVPAGCSWAVYLSGLLDCTQHYTGILTIGKCARQAIDPRYKSSAGFEYSPIKSKEMELAIAAMNSARLKKVLSALEGNWQAEMEGYHTYTTLADRDTDPVRAQVLRHLAQAELEHASLWASRIKNLGAPHRLTPG